MKRLALAALVCALPGYGATITLSAVSSGFYTDSGGFSAGNYAIGWYVGDNSEELRNYFVFDLSSVVGTITSATLRLQTQNGQTSSYISNDPTETFGVFDVSTSAATLDAGSGGVPAFTDLGSGTSYGSVVVDSQSLPSQIDTVLNAAALTYLNGGGTAVFGGALTSLAKGQTTEALFNSTNGTLTRELILEVADVSTPEPSTLALAGGALLLIAAWRRKRA